MASAYGLNATKLFPKIPKTPKISAIIPPIVSINANILIMIICLVKDENMKNIYNYKSFLIDSIFQVKKIADSVIFTHSPIHL